MECPVRSIDMHFCGICFIDFFLLTFFTTHHKSRFSFIVPVYQIDNGFNFQNEVERTVQDDIDTDSFG